MLAQMQYLFLSQRKCVFDLVIIKQCIRGVCVHRWHGLDLLQKIPRQPDEQMNHVVSPQTADPQLQRLLHMWPKHLNPSLLNKIWHLLFSWHYGIAFCVDLPLFTHQSLNFSKISGSHCAGVLVSLIFTQFMCNMHRNVDAQWYTGKNGVFLLWGVAGGVFCMLGLISAEWEQCCKHITSLLTPRRKSIYVGVVDR